MSDYAHYCEICGTRAWIQVYVGDVRDGIFGRRRVDTQVFRCGGCGVERLDEAACPDERFYETPAYRQHLEEGLSKEGHYSVAGELQIFAEQALWPNSLRGKTLLDIGYAGGSFLDHVSGRVGKTVAIEPCSLYHDSLLHRGYEVVDTRFIHSYGMANTFHWLRDRKPSGRKRISAITPLIDNL